VRIERGDHARDGFGKQFFVFDRLDIVRLDEPEHIGELTQFFDG